MPSKPLKNHSGAPCQRKEGPFSHTRSQDFFCLRVHFSFPQKVDDLFFSRRYVSERTFKR